MISKGLFLVLVVVIVIGGLVRNSVGQYPADCGPPCNLNCKSGLRVDSYGCPYCECVDPCEYPNCSPDQTCQVIQVQCIRAPCYNTSQCVKKDCSAVLCPITKPYCYLGVCYKFPIKG